VQKKTEPSTIEVKMGKKILKLNKNTF